LADRGEANSPPSNIISTVRNAFARVGNSVFKVGKAFARARNAVAPTSISSSQAGANSAPSQMNLFWVRHS
jgi:hypothetical protein